MTRYPKSPKEMTRGMIYFPRMLDKIRLHARGELHEDYHKNFGALELPIARAAISCECIIAICANALSKVEPMRKSWIGVPKKGGGPIKGVSSCGTALSRS
jgi:hypothetical protein